MKLSRAIPAGLLDAGLASLATFLTTFYAAARLDEVLLGSYGHFFNAFVLAQVIAKELLFTPVEVKAVDYEADRRTWLLAQSVRLGMPTAAASSVAVLAAVVVSLASSSEVTAGFVTAMALTTAAAIILIPIQQHVRRMLHLGGRSWRAATVSVVQFVVVLVALAVMWALDVPTRWVPFGALALGNAASLLVGLRLAALDRGRPIADRLTFRELAESGRYILVQGIATPVAAFIALALVGLLASAADAGYAAAARVLGQPVFVLAMGLSAVLGPRAMEAAAGYDLASARRIRNLFALLVGGVSALYVALVGWDWALNPLPELIPEAYEISGLLALTIVASAANGMLFPHRFELLAARKEVQLAGIEVAGNLVRTAVSAMAGFLRSYAVPLGFGTLAAVRWWQYQVVLRRYYAGAEEVARPGS